MSRASVTVIPVKLYSFISKSFIVFLDNDDGNLLSSEGTLK